MHSSRVHKPSLVLTMLIALILQSHAQNRVYLLGGASGTMPYGGFFYENDDFSKKLGTYAKFGSPFAELGVQSRITGNLYAYYGLGVSQLMVKDFSNTDSEFQFNQLSVSLPFLIRLNMQNLNLYYVDFGVVPTYLVSGKMTERQVSQTDSGSVAQWVPRTDLLFRMAWTINVNRFLFGFRGDVKLLKKSEAQFNEFKENWDLGGDSIFLRNEAPGNSFQFVYSAFVGLRIK